VSTESKLKAVSEHSLFGPPLVIEGEDAAAYDELFGRVCAAVRPVDVIDEMLAVDVVSLEWDVLRGRRWKTSLIRSLEVNALERFLTAHLDYDDYRKYFQDDLTEILQANLTQDQTEDDARRLAHQCAMNERDAVDKVNQILDGSLKSMNRILDRAKTRQAKELAQECIQHKPAATKLVDKLLARANSSIDALMVRELTGALDTIERIDRLITIAENRRNAMLREIDRRRAVLGEALRRKLQEVEGEFEVIDKTPEAKNAA
jgi:cobalamin biosynthesis Mg chelatase CobN